jgi:hypothetical protein
MALAAAPDNIVILSHYGRVLKLQRNFSGYFLISYLFLVFLSYLWPSPQVAAKLQRL